LERFAAGVDGARAAFLPEVNRKPRPKREPQAEPEGRAAAQSAHESAAAHLLHLDAEAERAGERWREVERRAG
jgi:hypothetical protein